MPRIGTLKKGYAIVLYRKYNRYIGNTQAIRLMDDLEEAKYNAQSMSRCDGEMYSVYDCEFQKLVY